MNLDRLQNIQHDTTTHSCIANNPLIQCSIAIHSVPSLIAEGMAGGIGALVAGPAGALVGVTGELVVSCVMGATYSALGNACDTNHHG